jgi:uncharacterized protein (TIGR01244 family)
MESMTRHQWRLATAVALTLVLTCGSANARSLDLPNEKEPLKGITTSGQPTAEQLATVAAAGYMTVIDLRTPKEDRGMDEEAVVKKLGMTYVSIPIDGAGGVTFANAATLDKLLSTAKEPVLLHCSSGNRAGALLALRAKHDGADDDDALALGVAAGVTGLKQTVQDKLAQGHD